MKAFAGFLFIFAGLIWCISSVSGQSYMNTRVRSIAGSYTTIATEAKDSKLVVLDFWTTWCKPCLKAIPKLIVLSDKYKDQGVVFIGVNGDGPKNLAKVKPLATNLGITYPVLLDQDQEISNELMITAFPTLIILDATGKILYTHQGYNPGDELVLEEEIKKQLGKDEK